MIVPKLASVYNDIVGHVGVLIEVSGYSKRGIEHHVGEF
jgi:CII-binding regulator of phage lambda lysogenization HflD